MIQANIMVALCCRTMSLIKRAMCMFHAVCNKIKFLQFSIHYLANKCYKFA